VHQGGARKILTQAQQFILLRNNPLCNQSDNNGQGKVRNGKLVWTYDAQSSPLGRIYKVEIQFEAGSAPDIFVRDPDIQLLAGDRDIPHVYHNPLSLCLYQPKKQQWHPKLRIDRTIVPWTALWLYYFEEWLESNDWKGEGEHPTSDERSNNRSSRRMISHLRSSTR